MSSALSIAAGGLRTATVQFESAARDIVSAGTSFQSEPAPQSDPSTSGGAPISLASFPEPDLTQGVIDLKLAEISYKANAKVFEVAANLQREALDILA